MDKVDGIKLEGDISPQEMFPIYLSNYDIDFLGKKAEELGVDTGTGYLSTFFAWTGYFLTKTHPGYLFIPGPFFDFWLKNKYAEFNRYAVQQALFQSGARKLVNFF